jgi:hypothetical protein
MSIRSEIDGRKDATMYADIPVPLSFRLPDGWQPVPPDAAGNPGAAFVAVNVATVETGFIANIGIDGEYRPDDARLSDLADASLRDLARVSSAIRLIDREDDGRPDALTQVIGMTAIVDDTVREVVQAQCYLALFDIENARKRVVIRVVLTSTVEQYPTLVEDFRAFVGSFELNSDG